MKIVVLGAGSLGCTIGAKLTESGGDVTLITLQRDHVDAMNAHGLRMLEGNEERTVKVKAATSCEGIGPVDLVVVLVKSAHTQAAIEGARSIVGPNTVVMSLQNGLGHEDILSDVVGRDRVLAGKTYVGGVLLSPGYVRIGTQGKETIIGELDGKVTARVEAIAETFTAAGLLTHVSDNIMGTIWDKLLINVATGAVSGITRLPYGGIYSIPEVVDCALSAVAEAMAVANASGIALSTTDPKQAWDKAAEGLPKEFKASILQSLEKREQTEIDFINGAVVRWGEKTGVATPVNKTLVAGIKGLEVWQAQYAPKA